MPSASAGKCLNPRDAPFKSPPNDEGFEKLGEDRCFCKHGHESHESDRSYKPQQHTNHINKHSTYMAAASTAQDPGIPPPPPFDPPQIPQRNAQVHDQGRTYSGPDFLGRDTSQKLDRERTRVAPSGTQAGDGHGGRTNFRQESNSSSPDAVDLNRASRKKADLIEHVKSLGVTVTGTETIKVLQTRGIQAVYDQSVPSGEDLVGFGLHAAKSYEELYQQEKSYVQWMLSEPSFCSPGLVADQPPEARQREKVTDIPSGSYWNGQDSLYDQALDRDLRHIIKVRSREHRDSGDEDDDPNASLISVGSQRGSPEPPGGKASQGKEDAVIRVSRQFQAFGSAINGLSHEDSFSGNSEVVGEEEPRGSSVCRMSPGCGRGLKQSVDNLLPETLQSLALYDRVHLVEVACSQDSVLTRTMNDLTGSEKAAGRLSIWNQFDLSTDQGVRGVLDVVDKTRPSHVWISTECGPYSVMQNINQRTEEQKMDLELKRKEVLKQYVGAAIVFSYCAQRGIHATWEWSQSCMAWRLPLVQHLSQKYEVFFAVIRGCQVNLPKQTW